MPSELGRGLESAADALATAAECAFKPSLGKIDDPKAHCHDETLKHPSANDEGAQDEGK